MKLQRRTIGKIRKLINEETEYRSGPNLVEFFNELGLPGSYGQSFPSRWFYTEEQLQKINGTQKMMDCLDKLFSPVNFIGRYKDLDKFIAELNQYLSFDGYKIVRDGNTIKIIKSSQNLDPKINISEDEFLQNEFKEVSIKALKLELPITQILEQRLKEIKTCQNSKAPLATIFLCGSTLEGILLGIANNNISIFNTATASPKDKNGKVLKFHEWTLSNLIDVAKEIGFLDEDVKKFSHSLRDFRNYIHPFQQASHYFNPDEHTAQLCWQVLKVAIFQIIRKNK